MAKRKRVSASGSQPEETSETASTDLDTNNGTIPVADRVFEAHVYPHGRSPSKKPKQGDWSDLLEQEGWEVGDKSTFYRISPIKKWDSMKKYKNFVVSTKNFGTGDYVYIYHGSEAQGANLDPGKSDCWVAKVLEIRAQDSSHVYLRVNWLYYPEELPKGGRQDYHASSELIASNHMEIMDAMTVTDKAEVAHLTEKYNEPPAEGLFWRQKYDYLSNKLSTLRKDCKCGRYHNPEKRLIFCSNCDLWLHEECLLDDALSRFADRRKGKASAPEGEPETAEGEGTSDTIKVDEKGESSVQANNTHKGKGRRKSRKSTSAVGEKIPRKDKLEAHLELKVDEAGDETEEATGKAIITDPNSNGDGESESFKEELTCLRCNASLSEQAAE